MAILSQRLHRLGHAGYDIIHLETDSRIVIRPNKETVEETLARLESIIGTMVSVQFMNEVPEQLKPGTMAIVGKNSYIGGVDGAPLSMNSDNNDESHI